MVKGLQEGENGSPGGMMISRYPFISVDFLVRHQRRESSGTTKTFRNKRRKNTTTTSSTSRQKQQQQQQQQQRPPYLYYATIVSLIFLLSLRIVGPGYSFFSISDNNNNNNNNSNSASQIFIRRKVSSFDYLKTIANFWNRLAFDSSLVQQQQQQQSVVEPPPEHQFYETHYQQMKKLFTTKATNSDSDNNNNNFMVWGTRNDTHPFHLLWKEFGNEYMLAKRRDSYDPYPWKDSKYIDFEEGVCFAAIAAADYRRFGSGGGRDSKLPHVSFSTMNENWGAFSESIPNKTANWVPNLTQTWLGQGCTRNVIYKYLNHPDTRASVTMQFQSINHPKAISLPLGLKTMDVANQLWNNLRHHNATQRPQWLMVNFESSDTRLTTIEAINRNFGPNNDGQKVTNTFRFPFPNLNAYLQEMRTSKFILAPGGIGLDCYRIWEALFMGTIPIIETLNRTDGWLSHTLSDLPIAFIDSYEHLTQQWLEKEYPKILHRYKHYNYNKLTKSYWIDLIKSKMEESETTPTTTTTTTTG